MSKRNQSIKVRKHDDGLVIDVNSDVLPDPEWLYSADRVDAYLEDVELVFLFAQIIPGTQRLATMVSIRYPIKEMTNFLSANSNFIELLEQRMNEQDAVRALDEDLRELALTIPDGKYHMERAVLARMGYTDSFPAEVSFYMVKPFKVNQLARNVHTNWNDAIQPLLSVYITTPVLLALLKKVSHLLELA